MTTAYTPEQIENAKVECRICGHRDLFLADHLAEAHGTTVEAYLREYPGSETVADLLLEAEEAARQARAPVLTLPSNTHA